MFSVIRVLKLKNGQECLVERTFDNADEAEVLTSNLNLRYGTNWMFWVVDKY